MKKKMVSGKWCPRREWSSPPDAQRAATDARRGVLYSSVFLGSPGKSSSLHKYENFTFCVFRIIFMFFNKISIFL